MALPPCDDFAASVLLPVVLGVPPGCSNANAGHAAHIQCSLRTRRQHTINNHTICGHCYDRTMNGQHARDTYLTATEFGPPGKPTGAAAVAGGIVTQGWPPLGQVARGFPDILFHQFWTRLCRTCEKIEQEKFDVLINTAAAAPGFVPQTEQARWNYPWNQCLCIKAIGWPGPTMQPPTLPGRNAAQPTLPPATGGAGGLRPRNCVGNTAIGVDSCYDSILDDLVARRDRNDLWLQRVSRAPDGTLCRASRATIRARNKEPSNSHRACRCGGDTSNTQPHNVEVLQCMSCQGLWCLRQLGTPGSKYTSRRPPRRNTPRAGAPLLHVRGAGNMVFPRPVAAYTDTGGP